MLSSPKAVAHKRKAVQSPQSKPNRMASITVGEVKLFPHACHYCQAVTLSLWHNPNTQSSSTVSELGTLDVTCARARHAAADGCKFFEYLMQTTPSDRESEDLLRYTFSYEKSPSKTCSINFLYPAISQDFEIYAGDEGTLDSFPAPPNLAPASAETASNWLASCVQEHSKCAKVDEVFAPPRLLRVACGHDEVHLVDMDITKPVLYAVLSYCWGGDQVFKTVKSNVQTISKAMKDLPQTIQDAVLVTRQLKLEYLWVDSMCIIQDSVEDKSALISQMHKIYECAQVTIAASKSSKCTNGFLAPRLNIPQFCIPIQYPVGKHSPHTLGSVILIPSSSQSVEPLVTRAWTLQESLLSRRVLSYGSRQLRWYCTTHEVCDGGVLDRRSSANSASFLSLKETVIDYPRRRVKLKLLPKDPTSLSWLDIVEQYTKRKISLSSDKLVAISAVAQRLISLTEGKWGQYYAGIWEERFFEQLLWAMSTGEIAKRPDEYRAPSWSWAAVDGRPKWPWIENLVEAKISCKLLEVDIRPLRSEAPFGAITTGRAKIFGRVKEAIWSADRRTMKDSKTHMAVTDKAMQIFPDALEDDAQEVTVHVLEVARRSSLRDTMNSFYITRIVSPSGGRYIAGLVLEHLGDELYRRVGFIGLRSSKIKMSAETPLDQWSIVENKQWWAEGFTEKAIIII